MGTYGQRQIARLSLLALTVALCTWALWGSDLRGPPGPDPRPVPPRSSSGHGHRSGPAKPAGGPGRPPAAALPRVTLTMHMASVPRLVTNLYCIVFRSAVTFWPAKLGKIGLIMDKESAADRRLAARLASHGEELGLPLAAIRYQELPADPGLFKRARYARKKGLGYQRQMWNTYFLDDYVDTPVVAYTDTDVMLSTPVAPGDIFSGDRLRVYVSNLWRPPAKGMLSEMAATLAATGKKMIGKCDPFPTYLWRDTVTNCRRHIMAHLNVTRFEDAFRELHINHYAANPIKTILTYAYYFEHDRYDWHFDVPASELALFNKEYVSPGGPRVTLADTAPTVVASTHKPSVDRGSPFEQGYCIALRHVAGRGRLPSWCEAFRNATDLHLFKTLTGPEPSHEFVPAGWCRRADDEAPASAAGRPRVSCRELSERHYREVAEYQRTESLYDFNMERVSAVEKIAAQMNATCPPLMKPPLWY